jgi:hypothetical protein
LQSQATRVYRWRSPLRPTACALCSALVQMWAGASRSGPDANVGEESQVPVQTGFGASPVPVQIGASGRGYQRKRSVLRHWQHHVTLDHHWRSQLRPTACGVALSPGADVDGVGQALVEMSEGASLRGGDPIRSWFPVRAVHATHRRAMSIHRSDAVHARSYKLSGHRSTVLTSIVQCTNAAATYSQAYS